MYDWKDIAYGLNEKYQCGWWHAMDTIDEAIRKYGKEKAHTGFCRLISENVSWNEVFED